MAAGRDLDEDIMSACMHAIMSGEASEVQISSFLTALLMKGETAQEIAAAARVMRSKASTIPLKNINTSALVDIVGTGGDMANTFNISTAAAFVASAAGCIIAKHGNRAATSSCGSADVLEALGVNIMLTPEQVARLYRTNRYRISVCPQSASCHEIRRICSCADFPADSF